MEICAVLVHCTSCVHTAWGGLRCLCWLVLLLLLRLRWLTQQDWLFGICIHYFCWNPLHLFFTAARAEHLQHAHTIESLWVMYISIYVCWTLNGHVARDMTSTFTVSIGMLILNSLWQCIRWCWQCLHTTTHLPPQPTSSTTRNCKAD